mgnify:CR=1 FL=1
MIGPYDFWAVEYAYRHAAGYTPLCGDRVTVYWKELWEFGGGVGGGMVFTFMKAQGLEIGDSLLDKDGLEVAQKVMAKASTANPPEPSVFYGHLYAGLYLEAQGDPKGSFEHIRKAAEQAGVPADQWAGVRVVVLGPQMPRRHNVAVQYFAKLLGIAGEPSTNMDTLTVSTVILVSSQSR